MLNFFSSQPQKETSPLNPLDFLDEPTQKKLFKFVAAQVVKTLGIEEAASYISYFLQKKFEAVKPEEVFKNLSSFVVVFAKAVLEAAEYPLATNTEKIMDLLEELYVDKSNSRATDALEARIAAFFAKVPQSVVTLLLPAYHSFLKSSQDLETDKKIFREVCFDRFLKPFILKASADEDHGAILVTLLKSIDPFKILGEKLEKERKVFSELKVKTPTVKTAKAIYESYLEMVQCSATVKQVADTFRKFSDTFNFETQSDWGYVYASVATNLEALDKKLIENMPNQTPEALKIRLVESKEVLVAALQPIWKDDPLANLSRLPQLEEEIADFRQRIYRLKALLSDFEKSFKTNSPAQQFYRQVFADCHKLFEELSIALVHNLGTMSKAQIWDEIETCQIKVSAMVARFINEPIDELTPLQRLVMRSCADQKEFQADLEFLLQQGALLTSTTTKYERQSSGVRERFASVFRGSKSALDVVQLAKLYDNEAVLSRAIKAVEAKEEETHQQNNALLKTMTSNLGSHTSSFSEGHRKASELSALSTTEEERLPSATATGVRIPSGTMVPTTPDKAEEPVLVSLKTSLGWQRDKKRDRGQRTPETTPRTSGDSTTLEQTKTRRLGAN